MTAKVLRYHSNDNDELLSDRSYPMICSLTCSFVECPNYYSDKCMKDYPTDKQMCQECDRECLYDGECHHLLTTAVECDGFGFSE